MEALEQWTLALALVLKLFTLYFVCVAVFTLRRMSAGLISGHGPFSSTSFQSFSMLLTVLPLLLSESPGAFFFPGTGGSGPRPGSGPGPVPPR